MKTPSILLRAVLVFIIGLLFFCAASPASAQIINIASGNGGYPPGIYTYSGSGTTLTDNIYSYCQGSSGGGNVIQNLGTGALTLDGFIQINGEGGFSFDDNGSGIIVNGAILAPYGFPNNISITEGNVTFDGANTFPDGLIIAGTLNINSVTDDNSPQPLGGDAGFALGGGPNNIAGVLNYTGAGGAWDGSIIINSNGNGYDTIQNSGSGTLNLTGNVAIYSTVLNLNDNGSGINISGAIGDGTPSGSVVVTGGNVWLTGLNTYTGDTSVNAGVLTINTVDVSTNPQSLGEGTMVNLGVAGVSSGVLNYIGAGGTLDKNINSYGYGGDTIQNNGSGLLTLSGAVTNAGGGINFNDNGSGITVTGVIQNGADTYIPVTIAGGSVTFAGANTYTGFTYVNAGTLNINTVDVFSNPQPLGEGSFVFLGVAGVSSGVLNYTGDGGTLDKNIISVGSGGDIIQNSGGGSNGPLTLTSAVTNGGGGLTFTDNGSGIVVNGVIQDGVVTGGPITVTGGNVTFNGANTYTGFTYINAGTLNINTVDVSANPQSLGLGSFVNLGVAGVFSSCVLNYTGSGGTLDKNINSYGYGSDTIQNSGSGLLTLSGAVTNGGAGVNFNDNGSGITVTGVIQNGAAPYIPVTIAGGSVTFAGANTYTGFTYVNAGTLNINTVVISTNPQSLGEGDTVFLGVADVSSGVLNYTYTGAYNTLDKNINSVGNGGDTIQNSGAGFTLSGAVTNGGGGLNFNCSNGNGIGINVTGVIQDGVITAAPITINGPYYGFVTFAGANTYTGNTNINAGTLYINTVDVSTNAQSLGEGSTVNLGVAYVSSGVLNYNGNGGTLDKNINSLGNGDDIIQNSGSGLLTLSGAVTNSGGGLIFNDNGSGINVTGVIGGSGGPVAIIGNGNVTFSNANTYTGNTNINYGSLSINTVSVSTNAQSLGEGNTVNLGGAGGPYGVLNYTGSGGTLDKNINSFGDGSDGIQNLGSGLLTITGTVTNGGGGYSITGEYNGINFYDNGSGINVTGMIVQSKPGPGVDISGGNVTFSNANTYTGDTNIKAGTLNINTVDVSTHAQPLGEGGAVNLGDGLSFVIPTTSGILNYTGAGGTLDKNINSRGSGGDAIQNSGSGLLTLTGTVTMGNEYDNSGFGGLNIIDKGGGITLNGVIQNSSNVVPLTITSGNVTLNNTANTYTGFTGVTAGKLTVNGSIASSGGVLISPGATLAGYGTVSQISGGGTVAPGGSHILTAPQIDPTTGLGFDFQFAQAGSPNYGNAMASGNDVLHVTGASPVTALLTGANSITADFTDAALSTGQVYLGGFYIDAPGTSNVTVFSETPNITYVGANGFTIQYQGLVADTANFGSGNVNGMVMEYKVVPNSSSTTLSVSAGASYTTVPAVTASGGLGSTASIAGGNASATGNVSMAFTGAGNFSNIASNVVTVSGMAKLGTTPAGATQTDQFVLELSINASAASQIAGGASALDLLWYNPLTSQWVNAVLGNSDIGAGAGSETMAEMSGAYDPGTDFNLSYYGVDVADGYAWAVLDHNSDFGVGNPDNPPIAVPEPSTWMMMGIGAVAFLARRRVKSHRLISD